MELNLSIGKVLLLTWIVISSQYCSNLFSSGLKDALESNKYVQHLVLILLIMSLILLFGNPFGVEITSSHTLNIAIITLLVYGWFILTTKLDMAWNVGIIILLAIYFLSESKYTSDLNIQLSDSGTSSDSKSKLVGEFLKYNNLALAGIFGITLVGTLFYASEKKVQYGGGFSLNNFWFGK